MKRKYAALLILALLLGCLGGCSSDKAAVTAALGNSVKTYAAALNPLLPDEGPDFDGGWRAEGDLTPSALPAAYSFLENAARVNFAAACAGEDAAEEGQLTLELGNLVLLTLELRSEDEMLYLGCSQLLGEDWLGVNRETLPEDLERLGLGEMITAAEDAGEAAAPAAAAATASTLSPLTEEEEKALLDAGKAVLRDIQVKKGAQESREVNGQEVPLRLYTVTLPSATARQLASALCTPLSRNLTGLNLSYSMVEEGSGGEERVEYRLSEIVAALPDTVGAMGDITLTLGIDQQKVLLAEGELAGSWEGRDFQKSYQLQLGGGENYVDDLMLLLRSPEGEGHSWELRSHGDHDAADGSFHDASTLVRDGDEENALTLQSRCTPGGEGENFSLLLNMGPQIALSAKGHLGFTGDSIELTDCLLSQQASDLTLSVALNCHVRPYQSLVAQPDAPLLLPEMSRTELEELVAGAMNRLGILSSLFAGV